jgi:hypothetical protein
LQPASATTRALRPPGPSASVITANGNHANREKPCNFYKSISTSKSNSVKHSGRCMGMPN